MLPFRGFYQDSIRKLLLHNLRRFFLDFIELLVTFDIEREQGIVRRDIQGARCAFQKWQTTVATHRKTTADRSQR